MTFLCDPCNLLCLRPSSSDRDFSIQVSTERRSFTAGEPLELRCTIEAQNVPERFFSVSWVFSSSPVAVVGPSAVPVLGPDYVSREAAGHMTVRKESTNVHLLKLQHLRPEDAGKYICRVTEREKTPTGDFIDRSKRSRNVQITVQPLSESQFVLQAAALVIRLSVVIFSRNNELLIIAVLSLIHNSSMEFHAMLLSTIALFFLALLHSLLSKVA